VKIRKLEATVKANEELLMYKDEELQMFKKDEVDVDYHGSQENDVVDFLLVFMNNRGFKRIADTILSFLDTKYFNQCRLVCRSWKNYIDNEWSMFSSKYFT